MLQSKNFTTYIFSPSSHKLHTQDPFKNVRILARAFDSISFHSSYPSLSNILNPNLHRASFQQLINMLSYLAPSYQFLSVLFLSLQSHHYCIFLYLQQLRLDLLQQSSNCSISILLCPVTSSDYPMKITQTKMQLHLPDDMHKNVYSSTFVIALNSVQHTNNRMNTYIFFYRHTMHCL